MTSIISRLFGSRPSKPDPVVTEADESYAAAVRESDDLRSQIVDNLATIAESAGSMTVKVTRKVNLRSKSEAKAA
jgi:hypothetical protein